MPQHRAVIYLSALLFIFGVSVFGVFAQEEDELWSCVYIVDGGEEEIYLDELDFEDCAYALYYQMSDDGMGEAYGYWGDYPVYVDANGEVYYGEGEVWEYWGELDIEGVSEGNEYTFDDTLEIAFADIDEFWQLVFEEVEEQYESPASLFFEEVSVSTECGEMDAARGPFYCPADYTMYYPVSFMIDQYERIGDFAPVVVIAHEWGHYVQHLWGLLDSQISIEFELQADCLAGAYGSYASYESEWVRLDANDIDEAMQSLFEVGDSVDTDWFDPEAHGTSEERQAAFLDGYDNGIYRCFGMDE